MTPADATVGSADPDAGLVRATSFTRALRAHPLWLLIGLILGLAIGVGALSVVPTSYSSTATVLVGRGVVTVTSAGSVGSTPDTQTAAQIAGSGTVAQQALTTIGGTATVRSALKNLTVGTPTDAATITLTYTANTAAKAKNGAQAFAQAYVATEQSTYASSLSTALANVDRQITAVQSAGAVKAAQPAQAAELSALASQRAALSAATVDAGSIISPAQLPGAKSGLPSWLYPVAGAIIGLLAGWSLALLRDRGDDRIRGRGDVEALGVPVLGQLGTRNRGSAEVTARLSMAVATAGARTLLVSEWPGTTGGASRLMGLLQSADPRVRALETNPSIAGNLLAGSDGVRTLLLEQGADDALLVMKSGPISRDPEALLPAAAADGVVVLARPGRLHAGQLVRAARDLERTGGRLLGVILVTGS